MGLDRGGQGHAGNGQDSAGADGSGSWPGRMLWGEGPGLGRNIGVSVHRLSPPKD